MCSSSKIRVDDLGVFFYFISELVERFKGGFATNGSEVGSLEDDFFVVNIARHG